MGHVELWAMLSSLESILCSCYIEHVNKTIGTVVTTVVAMFTLISTMTIITILQSLSHV